MASYNIFHCILFKFNLTLITFAKIITRTSFFQKFTMFLKFNDTFPTVVHDNELPNELLQDLRNHELQKSKISMNEETHVHVYEKLIRKVPTKSNMSSKMHNDVLQKK